MFGDVDGQTDRHPLCPQAYHDPMLKLSIMSEEELSHIFGDLDAYIPLHEGKAALLWHRLWHWRAGGSPTEPF